MTSMSFCYLCCQLWTDFNHCYGVFIVVFEQVNAGWESFENGRNPFADIYYANPGFYEKIVI